MARIFFSYSHKDESLRDELESIEHLIQAQSLGRQVAPHSNALLPSLLDRIFNS